MSKISLSAFLTALLGFCATNNASACAVCYGNPDSDMMQGAKAGVIFLIFVIYGLLMLMAGVAGFWIYRSKKLAAATESVAVPPHTPPQV